MALVIDTGIDFDACDTCGGPIQRRGQTEWLHTVTRLGDREVRMSARSDVVAGHTAEPRR